MGFFTAVVVAAATVFAIKLFFGDDSDPRQDDGQNDQSRSLPPTHPPRPHYHQPTYYGSNYSPEPARRPLTPRYSDVPQPSASTPVLRPSDVTGRPLPPRSQTWPTDDVPLSSDALRERAVEASKLMVEAFAKSKALRPSFPAAARQLTEKAREHKHTMEIFNKKASELIFKENNQDREPHEIDLHRLFVKEAQLKVSEAISAGLQRGDPLVRFIVGQGSHSENGISRLKPEMMTYIRG
ncbi:hypothetical protein B0H19DRAFT_1128638 [Mycena capillaripes]|nr:hypothetical protein B0H19DRAFT_1128638 [Mycena capillaripes]